MRPSIVWIIFRKEITEALRDRVTLLVLVGLPLLIYPLAMVMMTGLVRQQAVVEERQVHTVAVWGVGGGSLLDWLTQTNSRIKVERWRAIPAQLRSEFEAGRLHQPPPAKSAPPIPATLRPRLDEVPLAPTKPPDDAVIRAAGNVVSNLQADAVLIVWPGFDAAVQRHDLSSVSVCYDSVIPKSEQAWSRLSSQLKQFRQQLLRDRQRDRGLPEGFGTALEVRGEDVAPPERQLRGMIGQFLPVMLILLAVVGAMVAAIDLTAGEKDRATMQTLLCAPVSSFEIVMGKFVAVWCISLVAALTQIVGIGLTLSRVAATIQLDVIPFGALALAGLFLLPATWTIAALFVAIATLARDVKDAGNFLGAAALAVMMPVVATLWPFVELDAWTCCVPLVNLSLLIRAMMNGAVASHLVFLALLSSLVYAGLALAFAARVFGREQILLGGAFTWRSLLVGDRRGPSGPTPGLVLTLFPLIVVGLFYVGLATVRHGLLPSLLATQYGVLLLPVVLLALVRRFPLRQTFSWNRPHWRSVLGSMLIGGSAAVAVAGLVLRLAPPPDSFVREMQELFQFGSGSTPLWQLWLWLAFTPALCEETFFRGMMLSGLRRWGAWGAIGTSALLFGLLHGAIYRFLPTFMLGLLLGYVVWRSGSLFCSILIHALNNGLIATLAWSNPDIAVEPQSIPWSLTLGALALTAIGLAIITKPKAIAVVAKPGR